MFKVGDRVVRVVSGAITIAGSAGTVTVVRTNENLIEVKYDQSLDSIPGLLDCFIYEEVYNSPLYKALNESD